MLEIYFCSKLADSVTQLAGGGGDAIYREFQTNVDNAQSSLTLPHEDKLRSSGIRLHFRGWFFENICALHISPLLVQTLKKTEWQLKKLPQFKMEVTQSIKHTQQQNTKEWQNFPDWANKGFIERKPICRYI